MCSWLCHLDLVDLAIYQLVEGVPGARKVRDRFGRLVVKGEVGAYAADLAPQILGVDRIVEAGLDVLEQ
jgi:hypothetical protein